MAEIKLDVQDMNLGISRKFKSNEFVENFIREVFNAVMNKINKVEEK